VLFRSDRDAEPLRKPSRSRKSTAAKPAKAKADKEDTGSDLNGADPAPVEVAEPAPVAVVEPEPEPAPEPVVATPAPEPVAETPPKPKRRGWWSLGK